MKKLFIISLSLHAFIGIGAICGGGGAILDPSGESMGISTEILKNSPFDNFLIPGLFLFIVIGLGNIVCAITALKKVYIQSYLTGGIGFTLMMWIVVQCYMLREINILHVIFFILGFIQCINALLIAFKQKIFPLNYIFKGND